MLFYATFLYLLLEVFTQLFEVDEEKKLYTLANVFFGFAFAVALVYFLDAPLTIFVFLPVIVVLNFSRRILFGLSKLDDAPLFKFIFTIANLVLNLFVIKILSSISLIDYGSLPSILEDNGKYIIYILVFIVIYETLQRYLDLGIDLFKVRFESWVSFAITVVLGIVGGVMTYLAYLPDANITTLLIGFLIYISLISTLVISVLIFAEDYEDDFQLLYLYPIVFGLAIIFSIF